MQWPPSREFWLKIVILLMTLLAIGAEVYARWCGFMLTSDSLQYLSAARSFRAAGVFLSPDGSHYAYWPPLYPLLINLFNDPVQSLIAINIACKLAIGWLVYLLGRRYLSRTATRVAFAAGVLFGLHLLLISVFVWSELVFVTLALALLYRLTCCPDRLFSGALLVLGFLLCLQRNAGVFWIAGICSSWLLGRGWSLRNVAEAGVFFLLSTSGMWAWNAGNTWLIDADFAFYDQPFLSALGGNSRIAGSSLAAAFVPASNHIFWAVIFWIFMAAGAWTAWKFRSSNLVAPVVLALVYCAGFVLMGPLDVYEADRYFCVVPMVVYLPLLRALEWLCGRYAIASRVLVVVLLACSVYPLVRMGRNAQRWHERSCAVPPTPEMLMQPQIN